MKLSVIVPAHDTAAYVAGCMASVLDQARGDFSVELIVVDDASHDDTFAVASAAAAGRADVHVRKLPRNGGPGAGRNAGLDAAKGDWVLFLDSDDRLAPGALETVAAHIASHPDADVIAFDWSFDPEDPASRDRRGGRKDAARVMAERDALLADYLGLRTDGSVIFSAVRRSVIEENSLRFAPGLHEDVDFQFKVYALARAIAYADAPLYWKRARAGSIVETITPRHLDGFSAPSPKWPPSCRRASRRAGRRSRRIMRAASSASSPRACARSIDAARILPEPAPCFPISMPARRRPASRRPTARGRPSTNRSPRASSPS